MDKVERFYSNVLHYLQFRLRANQQNVANQKWTIAPKQKIHHWKTTSLHTTRVVSIAIQFYVVYWLVTQMSTSVVNKCWFLILFGTATASNVHNYQNSIRFISAYLHMAHILRQHRWDFYHLHFLPVVLEANDYRWQEDLTSVQIVWIKHVKIRWISSVISADLKKWC